MRRALAATTSRALAWLVLLAAAALASAADAPPPTVADILAIVEQYKPDAEKLRQTRLAYEQAPPATDDPAILARWYNEHARLAQELGEVHQRSADLEQAIAHAQRAAPQGKGIGSLPRIRTEYVSSLWASRGVRATLDATHELLKDIDPRTDPGRFIWANTDQLVSAYSLIGNLDAARQALAAAEAVSARVLKRVPDTPWKHAWRGQIENARASIAMTSGRHDEAESLFRVAVAEAHADLAGLAERQAQGKDARAEEALRHTLDTRELNLARTLMWQQRLDEAELLMREVLKRSLARLGRNNRTAADALSNLCQLMIERGRFPEALVLAQLSVDTFAAAGIAERDPKHLRARINLASALVTNGRWREGLPLYDRIRNQLADDPELQQSYAAGTPNLIRANILGGRKAQAIEEADTALQRNLRTLGADHYNTAQARGYRGWALHAAGRDAEARSEFAHAVPMLLDPERTAGFQSTSSGRIGRLRLILGDYIRLLAAGTPSAADVAESFRLADVARWQSVQRAVAIAAARSAADTPELANLIKREQDLGEELNALFELLIKIRSAPPERQLPEIATQMEQRIVVIRTERATLLKEIRQRFPRYDNLINPVPPSVAETQAALKDGESLLSIYVTTVGTYVWAVPKSGAPVFHASKLTAKQVAGLVKRLRAGLDPNLLDDPAGMAALDLEAGWTLFSSLLQPVAAGWENARTLLVVANGTLAQIPLSLLPTARPAPLVKGAQPLAEYAAVPWLARRLAIAYLPSVNAFIALRALRPASDERQAFIGFGDPQFGAAASTGALRGAGRKTRAVRNLDLRRPAASLGEPDEDGPAAPIVASEWLQLNQLAPLPDTRDEILAIAAALKANPGKDAFFGPAASKANLQQQNLRQRRVVAFATHGLVAGDLPGLEQPALALAPDPTRRDNGLLTLDDILRLNLNADWVVLSACNTAAAEGAGAEAISGLGRGFFHAGSRTLLATHWPVETVSARELITEVFRRYASTSGISRAEALRQAMLALMQRGDPAFSYAHPIFWAPYALYGDPG